MSGQQDQALIDAHAALEQSNRVPHQAIELGNSALKFAKDGDWETQAYAFAALGSAYASLGRFEEATRHVNEAQKIAFELRLTYVLARIHQARGWVAYSQEDSVGAFSDWQIAFDYFHQIRDMRGTAWILMHYADNYASLGLIDHSIRCQISALDNVGLIQDAQSVTELKINLARSYVRKAWDRTFDGNKGFSIFDAQIASAILIEVLKQKLDDFAPSLIEQAFQTMGEALLIQGRAAEALLNLKYAYKASTQNGHYSSEARVLGAKGYAHHINGDHEQGRNLIEEALDTAPEATTMVDLALLHMWRSQVLETLGELDESLKALRLSIEFDKNGHNARMERWSKVHDMTLGIGPALVSVEWVGLRENGWVYVEAELDNHQSHVNALLREDLLTGVLSKEIAQSTTEEMGFEFAAIFEIQNLDIVNRKFGRVVGDEVLRHAGCVLTATVLDKGVVGRYSGNEFFVAHSTDEFEAVEKAINKFPWLAINPELSVRVTYRRVQPAKPHLLAA